jgi:chromosome segregation ATPase
MRGAKGHATKRRIVSMVFLGALAALALGVTGCDKRLARMEENQIRLQAMVAANARQLAMISSQVYVNNGEVQEGIQKLNLNDEDLATGISTVQNQQGALQKSVTSASESIDKRMATLDSNQRLLQEGVGQVAGVTQRTASDVTAIAREQVSLHQMVQSSRHELSDSIAAVAANADRIRTDIGQLQQADQRMAEQIVALAAGQDRIHNGLDGMDKLMHAVAGDVTGISQGQVDLRQTVNEHNTLLADKTAVMERNQQNMQTALDGIAGQTKNNTEGIAAVDAHQTALQQTLSANHKIMTGQVAAVIENQQGLQAGVNGLSEKLGQTNAQLTALAAGQDAVRETMRNDSGAVTAKLAGLSDTQTGLQSNLTGLHQKADVIVSNVGTVRAEQASLSDALKANYGTVTDQVTQLSSGQHQLQGQLDVLIATAGQTALDVVTLSDDNAAMQQALQSHNEAMAHQIAGLTESQQQIRDGLDAVMTTTGQTALDVIAVTSQQDVLQRKLQDHDKAVGSRMVSLASSQEQMQNSLDIVTVTSGQTAIDIIDMAAGQNTLTQSLRGQNEAVTSQIGDLANSQQQTQSGLDTVVATAGQTALDMIALNEGQARLAQAVDADRRALADKLAEIVQSQQQWAQRFDAAQANVQTITANLTALEQHLTKLQGSLQPGLDGLTSQLGTNGQNRAQFETKVNQDIQAVVDAISQLRQDQASLADQMQQIQTRTQTQTKDIITAIQQLRQPPAEVKVSDSGTKLESSVAEAAAK